ncbi:reverse transcriptase domain-containing protein [Tanacetum coccineum]
MMFPLSLTREAKTWLDELNEGNIKRWGELRTAFISRFFPPALFDRLLGEIRAFSQYENESLTDAWLPGGIFLYKTPNQAYQLLEDKVLLKLDWAKNQKTKSTLKKTVSFADEGNSNTDTNKIMARMDAMTIKIEARYKELQSHAKQPTPDLDDDDMPMSREEEAKFMQTFRKTRFYNDYRDRDSNRDNWRSSGQNDNNRDNYRSNTDDKPYDLQKQFKDFMKSQQSTNAFVKETFMDLKTQPETVAKNHQASIQNLENKFDRLTDKQSGRPSGSLPSNTQPNPRGSKAYQPPQARNEHVNTVFTRSGKSYNPPDNPDDQQNKSENPINFDSDDEDDEPTTQPKTQPTKPVKETPLPKPYKPKIPDESSAMIQNKVPPKLGDPRSFLIPCNFNKTFSYNALANLGSSINLMPYSLYAKLSLETLKPTKMSVRLADRSFQHLVGIAENMLVEVGKFTFPADFVILEMEDKKDFDALLDEGRKILHSIEGNLLEEEIFSEFNEFIALTTDENSKSESDTEEPPFKKITINADYKIKTSLEEPPTDLELKPLPDNLEYVILEEPSFLPLIISSRLSAQNKSKLVSVLKKHKEAFSWKTTDIPGFCPSFCKHKIQLLDDKKPVVQKQKRLNPNMQEVVEKEIVKLLDTVIIYPIADSPWVSPIHCVPKKGGITVVTNKNDELVPTRTVTVWRVFFDYRKLNEATAKDQFPFSFMDQMLCNAPSTFQRCILAIFNDMIEESVKVFMDDFSVFGNSFDKCLDNLKKMLQRCKDAHLVLNWEKCHFMVKKGIVLGHKVSSAGHEVDKEKIDDRKGTKNVAADHLSRIENDESSDDSEVDDNFPGETLMEINTKDEP